MTPLVLQKLLPVGPAQPQSLKEKAEPSAGEEERVLWELGVCPGLS